MQCIVAHLKSMKFIEQHNISINFQMDQISSPPSNSTKPNQTKTLKTVILLHNTPISWHVYLFHFGHTENWYKITKYLINKNHQYAVCQRKPYVFNCKIGICAFTFCYNVFVKPQFLSHTYTQTVLIVHTDTTPER